MTGLTDERAEFRDKTTRLREMVDALGLAGVLLSSRPNFAWLSGGRSNGIDLSREAGAGALLLGADGRCRVLADAIEMPRLLGEALAGLDVEPVEYDWAEAIADPRLVARLAVRVLGDARPVGTDAPLPGLPEVRAEIRRARAPLTPAEASRYRMLGHDTGAVVGATCRGLVPGMTEFEIARRVADDLAAIGARSPVLLVGADDRVALYRHPVPTLTRWSRRVMVVVCAERDGLVVALTRIVAAGPDDPALAAKTTACAGVFAAMAAATQPGATGAEVFAAAVTGYAGAGAAGEQRRHHQGGAIGYESRDWIAHSQSDERVHARQAFAWNPSITGTKVEDTLLVDGDRLDVVTASPDWPVTPREVRGRTVRIAGVLTI